MVKRTIEIDAPIETVWKVIRDFKSYPDFLETMISANEKKKGSKVTAEFCIRVIKIIKYTLAFEMDKPNSLKWSLVEGDFMKANKGSWELTSLSKNKTKAVYSIDVKFGWLVPSNIGDQLTKIQLPETLEAFKQRCEQLVGDEKGGKHERA